MHGPHESATTPCHLVLDGQLNAGHGGRMWSVDSTAPSQSSNTNGTDNPVPHAHARGTWYARSSGNGRRSARCTRHAGRANRARCPCGRTCRSTSSGASDAGSPGVRTCGSTKCNTSGTSNAGSPGVRARWCTFGRKSGHCTACIRPASRWPTNRRPRTGGGTASRCSSLSAAWRCPCSPEWRACRRSPCRRA